MDMAVQLSTVSNSVKHFTACKPTLTHNLGVIMCISGKKDGANYDNEKLHSLHSH